MRDLRRALLIGDDCPRAAVLQPELERFLAEEREERHRDEARLVRRKVGDGGLVPLRKEHRHAIAPLDALRAEHVGKAIGEPRDVAEAERRHLAQSVDFEERGLVPRGGVAVRDVRADVEAVRDRPAEVGRASHGFSGRRPQRRRRVRPR